MTGWRHGLFAVCGLVFFVGRAGADDGGQLASTDAAGAEKGVEENGPKSAKAGKPADGKAKAEPAEDLLDADRDYWRSQTARFHLSSEVALGNPTSVSLRAGYGKPNWMWGGVMGEALTTGEFAAFGAFAKLNLLVVNASFGIRRVLPFNRYEVAARQNSYEQSDFLDGGQPRSNYSTLHAGLWGVIPAGPTLGLWNVRGIQVLDFPDGGAIFSETFRYTLEEDRALMPFLAWFVLLLDRRLQVGPAADAVITPGRALLVRVGGGAVYQLSTHIALQALATVPVTTPDRDLGLGRQMWGVLQAQWTWATDEPRPGFF